MKRFCFMCGKEIDWDSNSRSHFCTPGCYMDHTREVGRVKQKRLAKIKDKLFSEKDLVKKA